GEKKAAAAREYFIKTVQKKEMPDEIQPIPSPAPSVSIIDFLVVAGLADSRSDAKRKVEQGGVYVDGKRVESANLTLNSEVDNGKIIKAGKRNYRKIVF
ncbi:MAG: S4 domain-containing protein, partial [bacterium]